MGSSTWTHDGARGGSEGHNLRSVGPEKINDRVTYPKHKNKKARRREKRLADRKIDRWINGHVYRCVQGVQKKMQFLVL